MNGVLFFLWYTLWNRYKLDIQHLPEINTYPVVLCPPGQ